MSAYENTLMFLSEAMHLQIFSQRLTNFETIYALKRKGEGAFGIRKLKLELLPDFPITCQGILHENTLWGFLISKLEQQSFCLLHRILGEYQQRSHIENSLKNKMLFNKSFVNCFSSPY